MKMNFCFGCCGLLLGMTVAQVGSVKGESRVAQNVASGIQHDFTQDDQELLDVQQQLQGFAQQVSGFDQALNVVDEVRQPATA